MAMKNGTHPLYFDPVLSDERLSNTRVFVEENENTFYPKDEKTFQLIHNE